MANPDRLSGLDASFLHLETGGAHRHVGSCMVFEGEAPSYDELLAHVERRLHLVPRYRQRLVEVPLAQGRPVWADDAHFNAGYHVRHTALPEPAGVPALRTLLGRVFSQALDRGKPLWETWLVERVDGDRFALVTKTHQALVDGISGLDLASVLVDAAPGAPEPAGGAWYPRPAPTPAALLADALAERVAEPMGLARAMARDARGARAAIARAAAGVGAIVSAGVTAPASPLNGPIGPHRRVTWVEEDLERLRAIKAGLDGTVHDAVLAAVAGALRAWYRRHGFRTEGVTLRALAPLSVRGGAGDGAPAHMAPVYAPLPLWAEDPVERFRIVRDAMRALTARDQVLAAEVITRFTGFATPTVLAQAARIQSRQRMFNLAITNVPGPQHALHLAGRRLLAIQPQVPLAANTRLGVGVLSYDGRMSFGLVADQDRVPDLDVVAVALRASIDELAEAAGARRNGRPPRRSRDPQGASA